MDIQYNNDVIKLGNEPYLFLHQNNRAQRQFDLFTGRKVIDERNINHLAENYNYNYEIATSEHNAKYLHIVFPAKIPVFFDLFKKYGIDVKNCFDYFSKDCPKVLYPRNLNHNDFYIQDTHNSDYGKIKIIDYCLEHFDIEPVSAIKKWGTLSLVGDLGKKIGAEASNEAKFLGFEGLTIQSRNLSNRKALTGNTGELSLTVNNSMKAPRKNKLLLFGDSFAKSCVKYLSFYFGQILYVRSPFIISEIAKNFQPTHIITSNAERYLSSVPAWQEKEKEIFLTIRSSISNLDDETVKSNLKEIVGVAS